MPPFAPSWAMDTWRGSERDETICFWCSFKSRLSLLTAISAHKDEKKGKCVLGSIDFFPRSLFTLYRSLSQRLLSAVISWASPHIPYEASEVSRQACIVPGTIIHFWAVRVKNTATLRIKKSLPLALLNRKSKRSKKNPHTLIHTFELWGRERKWTRGGCADTRGVFRFGTRSVPPNSDRLKKMWFPSPWHP